MKTHIALFRGINVGGRHILPMKELTELLESLGAIGVRTYIQSGNAAFRSGNLDSVEFSHRITDAILRRCGFESRVLLMTQDDLAKALTQNPFPEAECEPKSLHLGFLASPPASPALAALERLKKDSERFQLIGEVFYLHAPEGIGRSKLAAQTERFLGVPMTSRNWRTACAISDLANRVSQF